MLAEHESAAIADTFISEACGIYGRRVSDLPFINALGGLRKQVKDPLVLVSDPTPLVRKTNDLQDINAPKVGAEINLDQKSMGILSPEQLLTGELASISRRLDDLDRITVDDDPNNLNCQHFAQHSQKARDLIEELRSAREPELIEQLEDDIRGEVVQATYARIFKKIPRFLQDTSDRLLLDTDSIKWSPSAFVLLNGLPVFKEYLQDAEILDPFAGSGSMMNFLAANEIPGKIIYGDISYPTEEGRKEGGRPIVGNSRYSPEINAIMHSYVFDGLPSWCQPELLSRIERMMHFDATAIPFGMESVDFIVTDPPYGLDLADGSLQFFIETLPELLDVSKKGGLFLVPMSWNQEIKSLFADTQILTGDLVEGYSKRLPRNLVYVPKRVKPELT